MTADPEKHEPIEPRTARELFLQHKEGNCSDSTVRNYKYQVKSFIQWCEDQCSIHPSGSIDTLVCPTAIYRIVTAVSEYYTISASVIRSL